MRIQDIPKFNKDGEVMGFEETTLVKDAIAQMAQNNFGSALVKRNGEFCGIFTERDLMSCFAYCGDNLGSITLGEVMTENPKTASVNDDVSDALNKMIQGRFRHLPITDENGKWVCILSLADLIEPALKDNSSGACSTASGCKIINKQTIAASIVTVLIYTLLLQFIL